MVIEDGSKDNTVDIAKQYNGKVIKNEGKENATASTLSK